MAIRDLFSVQLGTEASSDSWGALARPATAKLMGIADITIDPIVDVTTIDEIRGSQAPGFTSVITEVGGEASMEGVVTYEDIPYWLNGMFGAAGTTEDAGDTDYTDREWGAPLTNYDSDSPTPSIYTVVYGDESISATSTDTLALIGATMNSLTISGEDGQPLSFEASLFGKQVSEGALVSLADRTVSVVMGSHCALWIDPSSDAIGTTAIATTAFSFELSMSANRAPVRHLGANTPDGYRDAKMSGELALSLELNATSRAYLASIVGVADEVRKVVRIKATSGTNVFQFDFNGVAQSAPSVHTDRDGVVSVELVLSGEYSSVLGNWLAFLSTNTIATLA